ncbi:MAG: outer membrane protein assembly factor BamE [Gemmataceae bacterium]|nr:outer membrane protein assembly factor BamE [Gemmataceae bacterium]
MSKRVYLLGVGLLLVAGAFLLADWLLTPPLTPGVTERNVKRLRPGMTRGEVEAILGSLPPPPRQVGGFGGFGGGFGGFGREFGGGEVGEPGGAGGLGIRAFDPWTTPEPDPPACEVVIHPDGKAEVVGALGIVGWRPLPLVAVVGGDGTAWLHVGGGRLKRAVWEPNPGAAPRTGLAGRLRAWLGW